MSNLSIPQERCIEPKRMPGTIIDRLRATMNSLELTTAITALANAIACRLTVEELSLLAGIFVQLGDTLATIAAREAFCKQNET